MQPVLHSSISSSNSHTRHQFSSNSHIRHRFSNNLVRAVKELREPPVDPEPRDYQAQTDIPARPEGPVKTVMRRQCHLDPLARLSAQQASRDSQVIPVVRDHPVHLDLQEEHQHLDIPRPDHRDLPARQEETDSPEAQDNPDQQERFTKAKFQQARPVQPAHLDNPAAQDSPEALDHRHPDHQDHQEMMDSPEDQDNPEETDSLDLMATAEMAEVVIIVRHREHSPDTQREAERKKTSSKEALLPSPSFLPSTIPHTSSSHAILNHAPDKHARSYILPISLSPIFAHLSSVSL